MKKITFLMFLFPLFLIYPSANIADANEPQEKIVSGFNNVFVLKEGTLWSMGENRFGELGVGNTITNTTNLQQVKGPDGIGFLTNVKDISFSYGTALALKEDGTLWTWGLNNYGQLGDNTVINKSTPVQVKGPNGIGYLTNIISIGSGVDHQIALKSDGTVWSWGDNSYNQLGDNTFTKRKTPVQVKGTNGIDFLTNIKSISANSYHNLALKEDGTVWSWGPNWYGQLGDGTDIDRPAPVQVKGSNGVEFLTDVSKIAVGYAHSIILKNDGSVWSWGYNGFGQLGNGTTVDSSLPVQVLGTDGIGFLTDVKDISINLDTSAVLMKDHTVRIWGEGINGQLGNGNNQNSFVPKKVLGENGIGFLTNIVQFFPGSLGSYAVKSNGDILTWGKNVFNTLMNENSSQTNTPVKATLISLNPISITSVLIIPGFLQIGEFTNQINFEEYEIGLPDAILNITSPFEFSIEDFTGSWNGWNINFKIEEFKDGSIPLKDSSLVISCSNSNFFNANENGLKDGVGSVIQNDFICQEGSVEFGTSFTLISALNNENTATKHFFNFPTNFLTLTYSNENKKGNYVAQTTLELISGP